MNAPVTTLVFPAEALADMAQVLAADIHTPESRLAELPTSVRAN
jgi:hypothetical protein